MTPVEPQEIIQFWREAGASKWWMKNDDFDAEISKKFATTYKAAASGKLDHWQNQAESGLALILVLDQFSRNLFRNDPRAFDQDKNSVRIVKTLMGKGLDRKMPEDVGPFCYLPLMHSEDLADQQICLNEMQRIGQDGYVKAAQEHLDIIKEFGRFPHRNAVLNRQSSDAEIAFLQGGGFSG